MIRVLTFLFILSVDLVCFAQKTKIGEWAMHLNYTNTNVVTHENNKVYVGTKSGLFSYNTIDNSLTSFSKLDGLSSLNITALSHSNGSLLIGYNDGNIDILENNQIINLPYIQLANILGDKKINNIFVDENLAYVSCPFGIVVIDIDRFEVKETYYLSNDGTNTEVFEIYVFDGEINSSADIFLANKIFVATNKGLFYADKHDNLLNYEVWKNDSRISFSNQDIYPTEGIIVNGVLGFDKKTNGGKGLLISTNIDYSKMVVPWLGLVEYNFFQLNTNSFSKPSSSDLNLFIVNTGVPGDIVDAQYNKNSEKTTIIANDNYTQKVIVLNEDFQNVLSVNSADINGGDSDFLLVSGVASDDYNSSKKLFLADEKSGLIVVENNNLNLEVLELISPNGPAGINVGSLASNGNSVLFTHGGKTQPWNNLNNYQEVSFFDNNYWSQSNNLVDLGLYDALAVCSGFNDNHFFVGTWDNGLLEFVRDSLVNHYNEENTSGALEPIPNTNILRIGGVDVDNDDALWLTNSESNRPLVKFQDNNWTSFTVPNLSTSTMSGELLCTSNNQKWIQIREGGIVVAREGKGAIEAEKLNTGNGLASNTVNCFVEDGSGSIWVGTSQGLSVFYFPEQIFNDPSYSSEYILIETEDGYIERLFNNTEILDIKVDGGDRKWIGTKGSGVFLISEDGTSQIHNFTKENSPLLDNIVSKISIIEPSGEVFFATPEGVCSYRSNATESKSKFDQAIVFPNPVRRDYSGEIAISGLRDETSIKITDISGNLVFETTSVGGTATWNGKGFDGIRVATGVYLFLCTSSDFEDSVVKKVLIYN